MDWLFRYFGNFGVAILLITVIIKIFFFRSPTSPTPRWRRWTAVKLGDPRCLISQHSESSQFAGFSALE
jgi:hypothetical protein